MRTIILTFLGIFWLTSLQATNYTQLDDPTRDSRMDAFSMPVCTSERSKIIAVGPKDIHRHLWIKLTTLPADEILKDTSNLRITAFDRQDKEVGNTLLHIRRSDRAQPVALPLSWSVRDVFRLEISYLSKDPKDAGCIVSARLD